MTTHAGGGDSAPAESQNILYWDFFGPSAPQTAAHFKTHLGDFLRHNALNAHPIVLKSEQELHMAVVCSFDDPGSARAVAKTLRAAGRSTFTDAQV